MDGGQMKKKMKITRKAAPPKLSLQKVKQPVNKNVLGQKSSLKKKPSNMTSPSIPHPDLQWGDYSGLGTTGSRMT